MKRSVILILCIVLKMTTYSQALTKKTFYDSSWNDTDSAKAAYFEIITYKDTSKKAAVMKRWQVNGMLKSEVPYSDISKGKRHGFERSYYLNGQLKSNCHYVDGKIDGEVTTWYASGQVKRRDVFKNDTLVTGQCFGTTGKDTTHFDYAVNATYKGGHQVMASFVRKHIVYPKQAKRMGIYGTVMIQFIIGPDGKPKSEKIISHTDPIINEEALRVFRLMKDNWTPARLDGELVNAYLRMPVGFKLEPQ